MSWTRIESQKGPPMRTLGLARHLPTDWIVGQQIGVLAYALSQFDVQGLADPERRKLRRKCVDRLLEKAQEFKSLGVNPSTLVVSSLHILSQPATLDGLPKAARDRMQPWAKAFEDVVTGRWDSTGTPRPSQINGAKLLAHQILYSDARPKAIVEAAIAFLSERFADLARNESKQETIGQLLRTLRDATNPTDTLLQSVRELIVLLSAYTQAALLIRNALLDHVLAWPVLVFGRPGAEAVGAVSVPIAVDLIFDRQDEVTVSGNYVTHGSQNISVEGWMGHLRVATNIGKALWRAKNGNSGPWRNEVKESSARFDLAIVEEIMGGTPLRATFSDNSMEAYFAQVVLAKAIGRHAGFTAAVSGFAGAQRTILVPKAQAQQSQLAAMSPEPDGKDDDFEDIPAMLEEQTVLDWEFVWPGGVHQKKNYVYNSFKFDRFVLPVVRKSFDDDPELGHAYVETNHCRYLSDVADCVQIGGWRQFRYVRCPDVAHAIHKYHGELPTIETEQVTKCLALLSTSANGILRLPSDIDSASLFSALRHINFIRRLRAEFPAPSLSWSVIRTVPQETDARFWHLLLRTMGADRDAFARLRTMMNPKAAATIIANAFNSLFPGPADRSERAPDLVIILGGERLDIEEEDDLLAFARPLAFGPVMDELKALQLFSIPNSDMRQFLGATRLIILGSDQTIGQKSPPTTELDEADLETVQRLKTFRFGFTQQMASVVLRNHIGEPTAVRSKLKALCRKNFLTYGNGWYRLRDLDVSSLSASMNRSDAAMATGHFFAGVAFAPYLLKWPLPGLNIAEALLPDHIREAIFHFEEAAAFANRALQKNPERKNLNGIRDQARIAQQRIMRFFDAPTLGLVTKLSRNRKHMPCRETYELARELIDDWRERGENPRPHGLTILARAARQYWKELKENKETTHEADSLFNQILDIYDEALDGATHDASFRSELLLHVISHYASFLRRYGKGKTHQERCERLDQQAVSMLRVGKRGYAMWGEWFEYYGDSLENDKEASFIYQSGVIHTPKYFMNLPKAVGAALLAGADERTIIADLATVESSQLANVIAWMQHVSPWNIDFRKRKYVADRFNAGKKFILAHFAGGVSRATHHPKREAVRGVATS